jgi:hypothetical protein
LLSDATIDLLLLLNDTAAAVTIDDTIDLAAAAAAAAVYRSISLLSIDLPAVDRSITCYCCVD